MSIESKTHRPSPVEEVRVSEASRQMAREPTLTFWSIDDEIAWIVNEKIAVQRLLGDCKAEFASAIKEASACSRDGRDWYSRKRAIEAEHGERRKELNRRLSQLEQHLSAAKHRKKQEQHRIALNAGLLKADAKKENKTNAETAMRPDGSVDFGAAILLLVNEVRRLRAEFLESYTVIRTLLTPPDGAGSQPGSRGIAGDKPD